MLLSKAKDVQNKINRARGNEIKNQSLGRDVTYGSNRNYCKIISSSSSLET